MEETFGKTEEEEKENLEKGYDYETDVTKWMEAQVPKHRTKIDRSPNRGMYIQLLLSGVTYRELVTVAKHRWDEDISIRAFSEFNSRIPEDVKNPISRMEKFIKEAPYRVNEILMMEELVLKQRGRFNQGAVLESKAPAPFSSRSQVARDLHNLLVDLVDTKMKAGIIPKTPDRLEVTGGLKSVSDYTKEEKDEELKRINDKLKSSRKASNQ